jgi:Protein of unknown function (DUF2800)
MPKAHSSLVGGSSADRVLNCPASFQSIISLPDSVEVSSSYAEEGTFYHHVMDDLMRARQADNDKDLKLLASSWVGKKFYDRVLTGDHLSDGVEPALDTLDTLEKFYGGGFKVVSVEREVKFPGIPGAFGTGDLTLASRKYIILNDWKFGSGVPVKATYLSEDGRDEFANPQLMFYMAAARNTEPKLFDNTKKLVIAISQPRTEDPLTHAVIDRVELDYFVEDLQNAVIEALSRNARRQKGEWCRWAPCKVSCPLWTGPLLDLSALGIVTQQDIPANDYGEYLAKAKMLLDMALVLKPTIDEQIHTYLESGGKVPGWKLKLKTKNRAWAPEDVVVPALKKIGFADSEIWQKKLVTFTAADAAASLFPRTSASLRRPTRPWWQWKAIRPRRSSAPKRSSCSARR